MARYKINYLTGDSEIIEADGVEYDVDARDYTFTAADGKGVVALTPVASVLSVIRVTDPKGAITYPHQDGDVTVLGPEVFASTDGDVISWKGSNYTRRPGSTLGKVGA